MSDSNGFYYEAFNENKIDDLVYLFKLEGKIISKSYILNKFKFDQISSYKNYIGYIVYDLDNVPATFIGGFYMLIKVQKENLNAIQIGDVITNPKHRGKGLFVNNASHFFEYLRNNTNFDLVFGFPNENSSYGFFNKLGWHRNSNFQILTYNFKVVNIYGLFHKFKKITPFYNFYKNFILNLFVINKDLNLDIDSVESGVVKDVNFLKYKKRASNSVFIKFFRNYYFIKFVDGLQIDFVKIADLKSIKRDLNILSFLFGIKKIETFITSNSKIKNDLISLGFCVDTKREFNTGYLFLHNSERKEEFFFSICDTDEF